MVNRFFPPVDILPVADRWFITVLATSCAKGFAFNAVGFNLGDFTVAIYNCCGSFSFRIVIDHVRDEITEWPPSPGVLNCPFATPINLAAH